MSSAFDNAMSVHVLHAEGVSYRELGLMFGWNPARLMKILDGTAFEGSWDAALQRLGQGEPWHPRIAELAGRWGRDRLLASTRAADPRRRLYQQRVKRLIKCGIPYVR